MSDLIEIQKTAVSRDASQLTAVEIRQHVNTVQEVMKAVMKPDVHYGKVPGTDKPTLYKAGAEVLCMTFRIADDFRVEDLSTDDMIRYRVTCIGKHQITCAELGRGLGEASSGEEKYKWRSAVCLEEFEETPLHLRRVKFGKKKGGGFYRANQVRTEPADLANTVLKMACKRAKIAMTLNVTAASDMFTQDIEDLPEELRGQDEDGVANSVNTELLQKWTDAANAAQDETTLKAMWPEAVKEFKAADDLDGANAFKKVITDRGAALKESAAKIAEEIAKAKVVIEPVLDEFVRAMEEAEKNDPN